MSVVPIYSDDPGGSQPVLHDIPAMLRNLADEIEAGREGVLGRVLLVLIRDGQGPDLRSFGPLPSRAQAFLELHAAAAAVLAEAYP